MLPEKLVQIIPEKQSTAYKLPTNNELLFTSLILMVGADKYCILENNFF